MLVPTKHLKISNALIIVGLAILGWSPALVFVL